MGWGIAREHRGKGHASEGAVGAMDSAFFVLGWPELIHCIAQENENSKGVAKKLGSTFLRDGAMPPPLMNLRAEVWGQPREPWKARA